MLFVTYCTVTVVSIILAASKAVEENMDLGLLRQLLNLCDDGCEIKCFSKSIASKSGKKTHTEDQGPGAGFVPTNHHILLSSCLYTHTWA